MALRRRRDAENLLAVLEVDLTDAAGDHPVEIGRALARPREQDLFGRDAGLEGCRELGAGGDLGARPLLVEDADDGRVRVRLHGVVDFGEAGQSRAQRPVGPAHHLGIVDEERRAEFLGEIGQRQAADMENAAPIARKILGDQRGGEVGSIGHRRSISAAARSAVRRL